MLLKKFKKFLMNYFLLFSSIIMLAGCAARQTPEYHLKMAGRHFSKGEYHRAVKQCQQALIEYPFHKEAQYNLGNAYFELEQYDQAIQAYQQAVWIQETYPAPHYGLGISYARQVNLEKAAEELRRYLELVPGDKRAEDLLKKIEGGKR